MIGLSKRDVMVMGICVGMSSGVVSAIFYGLGYNNGKNQGITQSKDEIVLSLADERYKYPVGQDKNY